MKTEDGRRKKDNPPGRVLQIWFYTIKYKLTNEGKKYQIKIKKYLTRGKDLNILYPLKGNNK